MTTNQQPEWEEEFKKQFDCYINAIESPTEDVLVFIRKQIEEAYQRGKNEADVQAWQVANETIANARREGARELAEKVRMEKKDAYEAGRNSDPEMESWEAGYNQAVEELNFKLDKLLNG